MKIIFTCASFGQLLHSSWEIPVLFTVITVVTGVQIDYIGCDSAKTDLDCARPHGHLFIKPYAYRLMQGSLELNEAVTPSNGSILKLSMINGKVTVSYYTQPPYTGFHTEPVKQVH